MGLFSGVGKFVKRITTPPKGILRDVFGRSVLDEIGTGVGFALGGPAGSAIGRGLGKGAATGDVGKALGGAVEGYALGSLGAAAKAGLAGAGGGVTGLGGKTGVGGVLQSLGKSAKPITSIGKGLIGNVAGMAGGGSAPTGGGAPGASGTGGGGGASGLLGILSNPGAVQGIGMLAGAGGAYMQGRSEDQQAKFAQDQIVYQRERNAQWDPMRMQMMNTLVSRLGGGAPPAPTASVGQTMAMQPSAPIPSMRSADTLQPPAGTIAPRGLGGIFANLPSNLGSRGFPTIAGLGGYGAGAVMPPSRPTDMGGMTPRPGGLAPTRPTTVPSPAASGMGMLGRAFEPTGVEPRPSPAVPGMMGGREEEEDRIAALLARMGAASRGRMG